MKIINLKKIVALILVLATSMIGLSACRSSSSIDSNSKVLNTPIYISENDEWWDSKEISLVPDLLSFDMNSSNVTINTKVFPVTDDKVYVNYAGYEYLEDDFRIVNEIALYSINSNTQGEVIGVLDVTDLVSSDEGFIDSVGGFFEIDGETKMIIQIQYLDMRGNKLYVCDVDFSNQSLGELNEIDISSIGLGYVSINSVFNMNGLVYMFGYEEGKGIILVLDNGSCKKLTLNKVDAILDIKKVSDEELIMSVVTDGKKAYKLFDTVTCTISEVSEFSGQIGIERHFLMALDTNEVLLDFNNTVIPFDKFSSSQIVSCGFDRIILWNETELIVLNKADSNPNAGKQIIKAAHLEPLTPLESEGMALFNKTSQAYFVMDDDQYVYLNIIDWDITTNDFNAEIKKARVEMVNKLMSDIASGEGPDVILGASDCRELVNSDCLVDISSDIKELNLNSDEYYMGIINSTNINSRQYFLPLDVYLEGLILNSKDIEDIDGGITIDEYPGFVSGICNGRDPLYIYGSRIDYFNQLVGISFDLYEKEEGTISFDNDDFKALALYVKDNVPKEFEYKEGVVKTTLGNISSDYSIYGESLCNKEFIGFPSPDARGVICDIVSSASISNGSSCKDGSFEFVSMLLCDEVLRYSSAMPVSRSAFSSLAITEVDGTPISKNIVDRYDYFASSCSTYFSTDYTVIQIISEEMPAYFDGQKSIDEVINVIDSRVSILISERK